MSELTCDDGWTPVLSPDRQFYCSPRCGGGKLCRREWYDRAVSEASALAVRMGDGWEPDVWENLGWHWRLLKGFFKLYPDGDKYSAWFEPGLVLTCKSIQFIASAETPEDAVGFVIQDARTLIARIEQALDSTTPENARD